MKYDIECDPNAVIESAAGFLARGWRRSQVKRALRIKFSLDKKDDLEEILVAAQARLNSEDVDSKKVLSFARAFFRELAADETVTDSARIRAMERFCALHGLMGGDSSGDSIDDQQQRIRDFLSESADSVPVEDT